MTLPRPPLLRRLCFPPFSSSSLCSSHVPFCSPFSRVYPLPPAQTFTGFSVHMKVRGKLAWNLNVLLYCLFKSSPEARFTETRQGLEPCPAQPAAGYSGHSVRQLLEAEGVSVGGAGCRSPPQRLAGLCRGHSLRGPWDGLCPLWPGLGCPPPLGPTTQLPGARSHLLGARRTLSTKIYSW